MPKLTVEDKIQREVDVLDKKIQLKTAEARTLAEERARLQKALETLKAPEPEKGA